MMLVARIDYALTRGINWLTTCLVERARGYNSSEAGDYLEETCLFCGKLRTERFCRPGVLHGGQDWAADALAEFVDVQSTFRSSADDRIMDALRSYEATQTPVAGQRGENPAGVAPPTPAGSSEHHCDCGLSDDMEDLDTHAAVCTIWDGPTCYFCGNPTANVVNTDWDDNETEFVCKKCAADELGALPMPTGPSPTIASRQHQPSVGGEGSPLDSAIPPAPRGEHPTWVDWAVPAICDVLADHTALVPIGDALVHCGGLDGECHSHYGDWELWREHVAGAIAERLEAASKARFCIDDGEPQTVALNAVEFERYLDGWLNSGREHVAQFETGLDMGARIDGASEIFPQHRNTQK